METTFQVDCRSQFNEMYSMTKSFIVIWLSSEQYLWIFLAYLGITYLVKVVSSNLSMIYLLCVVGFKIMFVKVLDFYLSNISTSINWDKSTVIRFVVLFRMEITASLTIKDSPEFCNKEFFDEVYWGHFLLMF